MAITGIYDLSILERRIHIRNPPFQYYNVMDTAALIHVNP